MNNHLSPEVRVNKNGVPVVKHVRTDTNARTSGKSVIPQPTVAAPPTRAKKIPAARLKMKKWEATGFSTSHRELVKAVTKTLPSYRLKGFEASDQDAYELMAVVDPKNVAPLLYFGIKTGEEAVAFLRSNGLERLIKDNKEFAEQVALHGANPKSVIQMTEDLPEISFKHPLYFDAVAVHGGKALRWTELNYGITRKVLDGKISAKDIKIVGGTRIASAGRDSALVAELEKIHAGESLMTAETLAQVVAKSDHRNGTKADPYTVNETVDYAKLYGAENIIAIDRLHSISVNAKRMRGLEEDNAVIGRALVWQDQVRKINRSGIDPEAALMLYKAGISPEVASEHYRTGMNAQQVLAVSEEGISHSVSSGWL